MKNFLVVFILLSFSLLHAQKTTVSFSKKFSLKDPGLTDKEGTTIRTGDFYYSMEVDYKGMQLAYTAKLDKIKYGINLYKYDQDMKEVKKISLHGRDKKMGPFSPQMLLFNGKIHIAYYEAQEDNSIKLSLSVIDPETLNETGSKELYTISEKNVGMFKMSGVIDDNRLSLSLSPDSSKLLVVQAGNTNEIFSCTVSRDMEIGKPLISKFRNLESFNLQNCFIDNEGNRYCSYTYVIGKLKKRGILLQNNKGQEKYLVFNTGQGKWEANTLAFKPSKDNSKIYVYSNYYGDFMDEGVLLTTVDAGQFAIAPSQLFPYPQDIRGKMVSMGFGLKDKGGYTVNRADYGCNELEDGTIVFTGYPTYTKSATNVGPQGNINISERHAGPIINIFIKSGDAKFAVFYRDQLDNAAGGVIAVPWHNKLVCFYNEVKKNTQSNETTNTTDKPTWVVLAQADISSDGNIISTKEIAANTPAGIYFTRNCLSVSGNRYIIPIGRNRVNMVRYFTELVQWVTLDLN